MLQITARIFKGNQLIGYVITDGNEEKPVTKEQAWYYAKEKMIQNVVAVGTQFDPSLSGTNGFELKSLPQRKLEEVKNKHSSNEEDNLSKFADYFMSFKRQLSESEAKKYKEEFEWGYGLLLLNENIANKIAAYLGIILGVEVTRIDTCLYGYTYSCRIIYIVEDIDDNGIVHISISEGPYISSTDSKKELIAKLKNERADLMYLDSRNTYGFSVLEVYEVIDNLIKSYSSEYGACIEMNANTWVTGDDACILYETDKVDVCIGQVTIYKDRAKLDEPYVRISIDRPIGFVDRTLDTYIEINLVKENYEIKLNEIINTLERVLGVRQSTKQPKELINKLKKASSPKGIFDAFKR